ncbi:hypothetical protein BH10BAC5_BH10BAC5_20830 [soil metagenome]
MENTDPRIDAYIDKAKDFAKPILKHIRKVVHEACPDVEETWKWSFPHFVYKGSTLCSMAAFKEHFAFGFWKASLMKDPYKLMNSKESMGQFGRIANIKDLPSDKILKEYIKEAAKLNEEGVKITKQKKAEKPPLEIPEFFMKALSKNKDVKKNFELFSQSCKREYIQWLVEAKTDVTREKRMEQALEWIGEGKKRNWKYENC